MTVTHVGSSVKYSEGWASIFKTANKTTAKKKPAAAKASSGVAKKKSAKKKAKR